MDFETSWVAIVLCGFSIVLEAIVLIFSICIGEIFAGSIGVFEMKATKVGEDSSIQRMIKLVQSANTDKVKIVNLADRWATWIVVGALTSALITWLITGEIIRAVTILVGNQKLIEEHQIAINFSLTKKVKEYLLQGGTVIFVSIDSVLCGYLVLFDTVREETSNMISSIVNLEIAPILSN